MRKNGKRFSSYPWFASIYWPQVKALTWISYPPHLVFPKGIFRNNFLKWWAWRRAHCMHLTVSIKVYNKYLLQTYLLLRLPMNAVTMTRPILLRSLENLPELAHFKSGVRLSKMELNFRKQSILDCRSILTLAYYCWTYLYAFLSPLQCFSKSQSPYLHPIYFR